MNGVKRPLLSFCIPTFNRAERVYACVMHILKNDNDNIEVVVSNNASTDNTVDLLATINDKRLRVFSNEKNIGILNWPQAISRARTQWAALLSDEDIVEISNLDYFVSLLEIADRESMSAIIYNFPHALAIQNEYKCKNLAESIMIAIKYGGHITGHILNMRFFELGNLDDYLGCGEPINEDEIFVSNPPVAEPQHEILLRNAALSPIMITGVSLCTYGVPVPENDYVIPIIPKPHKIHWGGLSITRREIMCKAFFHRALLHSQQVPLNSDNHYHLASAICTIAGKLTFYASEWYNAVTLNRHWFRPALIDYAHKLLGYSRADVMPRIEDHLTKFMNYCAGYCDNFLIELIRHYTPLVLRGDVFSPIDRKIEPKYRVLLGDYLFVLLFNTSYFRAGCDEYMWLIEDSEDLLELKKTDTLLKLFNKDKNYDKIIHYQDISTFRAHYIRGRAYLAQHEYVNAMEKFELFIDVIDNPRCIADIMTHAKSVQYAYYYLGYINQKLCNYNKSIEYFAKCYDLTDKLMLGENLVPQRLDLPK